MPIKVDFSDVQSFEPIPSGIYPLSITGVEEKVGKDSNEPYLNWTFEVAEGEFQGKKLWGITTLQSSGLFKLRELLFAVGEIDDPESKEELDFEPDDLVGKTLQGTVVLKPHYQDSSRKQNSLDKYQPF